MKIKATVVRAKNQLSNGPDEPWHGTDKEGTHGVLKVTCTTDEGKPFDLRGRDFFYLRTADHAYCREIDEALELICEKLKDQ